MQDLKKITIVSSNLLLKRNWEIKLFHYLLKFPSVKLNLIIINKKKSLLPKVNIISFILLKILFFIEKKFIKLKMISEHEEVIKKLSKIDPQYVNQTNKKYLADLSSLINDNFPDLIINLTDVEINKCNIIKFPKFFVWNFFKSDEKIDEIITEFKNFCADIDIYRQKILINRNNNTDQFLTINLNRFKCFYQTKEYASVKMCNVLISEINKLQFNSEISVDNNNNELEDINQIKKNNFILIFSILKYFLKTYSEIFIRKYFSTLSFLNNKNQYKWHLAHIHNDNYQVNSSELIIHKSNNDEFWADPFLFNYNSTDYVFFENYKYKDSKGIISVGELIDNKIVNVKDIIKCNYHLSYPYVFEYENDIYMIPETQQSKRLEIWKSKNFPNEWEIHKTVFTGIKMVDSSILKYKNEYWLFTNIGDDFYNDFTTSLSIFKVDSPLLNKIEPHSLNPVIIGTENSRNAGSVFQDKNSNFIRPSQAYTGDVYGRYINLSKIIQLNLQQYKEEVIERIMPNQKDNIKGFHHINKSGDKYVLDVFMKK